MKRTRTALVATIVSTISISLVAIPGADAAVNVPSAATPSALRYTIANGDYLAGVARKLGVTLPDLLAVNQFTVSSVIHPGQTIIVPEGGTLPADTAPSAAAPAAIAAAASYVVVAGDYLAAIARKLGVTLPNLLSTNNLTATSVITPGQNLVVPAGGTLPTAKPDAAPVAAAPAAGAATTNYTVAAGDYLVGIAAKNGVTLKALLAANDLIVTSAIMPGRVLVIPPATLPIPAAAPAATPAPTEESVDAPATGAAAAVTPDAGTAAYQAKIDTLIGFLQAQVGKPYVFNTAGPDSYDCSGLVSAAYLQLGIVLPHQSLLQSTKGTAVDWRAEDVRAGDLIFQFNSANPTVISHVGIAISSTTWIQAMRTGTPVKIGPIPIDDKIQAVRRIVVP